MAKPPTRGNPTNDGHRPLNEGHRPLKVQGGHRPATTGEQAPNPPTGGSGIEKPKKD